MPGPVTITDVQALAEKLARQGLIGPLSVGKHVQIMFRGGVLCGRVTEVTTGEDGQRVLRVRSQIGAHYVRPLSVRACEGADSRCGCATDTGRRDGLPARRAGAGVQAPFAAPLGNTGITR